MFHCSETVRTKNVVIKEWIGYPPLANILYIYNIEPNDAYTPY